MSDLYQQAWDKEGGENFGIICIVSQISGPLWKHNMPLCVEFFRNLKRETNGQMFRNLQRETNGQMNFFKCT
jgi:hypothetical protein